MTPKWIGRIGWSIASILLLSDVAVGQAKPDLSCRWDAQLTKETEKRINAEIDALGKSVKAKLKPEELKVVEEAIDRQLTILRDWSTSGTYRGPSKSLGPWFTGFRRHKDKGTDIKKAPIINPSSPIAGLEIGVSNKSFAFRHEAKFDWSSGLGRFSNNWSDQTPVDEEYHISVTGQLRLNLMVEVKKNGKTIRAEGKINKHIFRSHPIILKGSDAEVINPLNS